VFEARRRAGQGRHRPRPEDARRARRQRSERLQGRRPRSPRCRLGSPLSAIPDWENLLAEALADLRARTSEAEIRQSQAGWLRRVNDLLKRLPELPKEERKDFGVRANAAKREIEAETQRLLTILAARARQRDLERVVDVTMPGRAAPPGHLNIISQVTRELT